MLPVAYYRQQYLYTFFLKWPYVFFYTPIFKDWSKFVIEIQGRVSCIILMDVCSEKFHNVEKWRPICKRVIAGIERVNIIGLHVANHIDTCFIISFG